MGSSATKCISKEKKPKGKIPVKCDMDADGDGTVTLDEFTAYLNRYQLGFTNEQIAAMFKHCDKDNSGHLSLDEVSWLLSLAESDSNQMGVRVRIVVPSTSAVSVAADPRDFEARLASFQNLLCKICGGCTVYPAQQGSYLANNGEVVEEMVASVETFCTKKKWHENEELIRNAIRTKCTEWGQECIALEINGVLEYVVPDNDKASNVVGNAESLLRQLAVRVQMAKDVKNP